MCVYVIMLIFVCILCYYICIFGKKLLRACVLLLFKNRIQIKFSYNIFLSYLWLSDQFIYNLKAESRPIQAARVFICYNRLVICHIICIQSVWIDNNVWTSVVANIEIKKNTGAALPNFRKFWLDWTLCHLRYPTVAIRSPSKRVVVDSSFWLPKTVLHI